MSDFKKEWSNNDIYNFYVEFNRIESYNQYVEQWLKNYYKIDFNNYNFNHKTNWNINDIIDLNDYNKVKKNINKLLNIINSINILTTSEQLNQTFNSAKANEIENSLNEILSYLGNLQFENKVCGLSMCGNNLNIVGG